MPKKAEPKYSRAMEELEAIIEEIESESIDVDSLAEKVKRASYLIGLCRGKLKDTEGEVKKVLDSLEDAPDIEDEDEDEGEDEEGPEGEADSLF